MSKKIIDIFPPSPTRNLKEKIFLLPNKTANFWTKSKKIALLFFIFIGSVFALIYFVFYKITIEIWPETQDFELEENIVADLEKKNSDDSVLSKTIPAVIINTEEIRAAQSFPSSGNISKESKAQGKITIYNNYSRSQLLIVNTRFQPPSEEAVLYFRSTKAVTVPAKGTIVVDVVADRAGEEYNIEPVTFSIPGLVGSPQYTNITGKSFSKMEGGFKGDVAIVEKDDIESAKNVLVTQLFEKARESLRIKAADEYIILDGSSKEEVIDASSSVEAGKEAKSFTFEAAVRSQALVFKKNDLENFVRELIKSEIRDGQKIKEDSLIFDYSSESIDLNSGKITLKLKFSAKVYSDINIASLKEMIKKKSLKEANAILEKQEQVKQVKITAWPPWIKNIPDNDEKMKFKLTIDPPPISP